MELEAQIIDLEKALLTFEVRHSEEKLRELIAPEFKEIGASGAFFGLEDVLARLPTEQSWAASVKDFEFRKITDEVCQLIFRAYIKANDSDEGTYSLRCSLWKRFEDGWKIIFHQGTKVAPFEVSP